MTRSELIQKLQKQDAGLTAQQAEASVESIFNTILEKLAAGGRVELRGFGVFTTRQRAPRTGRNPRTGAQVSITQKRVPFFKAGKQLNDRLNP